MKRDLCSSFPPSFFSVHPTSANLRIPLIGERRNREKRERKRDSIPDTDRSEISHETSDVAKKKKDKEKAKNTVNEGGGRYQNEGRTEKYARDTTKLRPLTKET